MVNDDRGRLDKRYDREEFRISETASHIDTCENWGASDPPKPDLENCKGIARCYGDAFLSLLIEELSTILIF